MEPTRNSPFVLWNTDLNHQPSDPRAPHIALEASLPYVYSKKFREIDKIFSLLEITDLSKADMDDTDWKIFSFLCQIDYKLSQVNGKTPLIKLTMNGQEALLNKNVVMSNVYFRELRASERNENQIGLEDSPYSKDAVEQFLHFLAYENVNFSGDTIGEIFDMSKKFILPELEEQAFCWLTNNLSVKTLKETLILGLQFENPTLITDCIYFAWGLELNALKELIDEDIEDATLILESLLTLQEAGFTGEMAGANFEVASSSLLSPGILKSLNSLCRFAPIQLSLGKMTDDLLLKEIMDYLPNLEHLFISFGSKVTTIPGIERLKSLSCRGSEVESLEAVEVKHLDCSHCTFLKILNAPQAYEVDCTGCSALEDFKAPLAEIVSSSSCTSLIELILPNAVDLTCYNSTNLVKIFATKLMKMTAEGLDALTSLTISQFCDYPYTYQKFIKSQL
jgi:hypothetical protein